MLADGRHARRLGLDALSGTGAGRYHTPIRGRGAETTQIGNGFASAAAGDQAVTLLSGDPGIGKTRLLQYALDVATDHGWGTMVVAPDVDSPLSPLGAMISAATRTSPPLVANDDIGPLMQSPAPKYWLTRMIADGLESMAGRSGALVIVDDLQWLDAGSLGALAALMHDLQGVPIYWLLATRTGVYSAAHQRFLADVGELTSTMALAPLNESAADEMVRDALGSKPGPSVERAITRAAGYPLLILELIRGLQEEGLLQAAGGVVDLSEDTLPARFGTSTRDRLRHLSRNALRIAQIGSLYGRTFPLGGVLDILGQSAAAAAPAVQELLDLGFIVDTSTSFAFRHDTVQAAASESLSPSLRRAMTREVIHSRLRAGEGVATLASSIVSVAETGDDESIELLFLAAHQLSSIDVHGAAGLIISGARLISTNVDHAHRAATMLPIVVAGGRVEEAMEISRTLRPLLPPDARAQVSLALARQLTESDFDGAIRETDAGLAIPGASDASRVALLSVRALNFANKADEVRLRTTLAQARDIADETRDGLALATLDATESVLVFYQHDFDEAERLQRKALERVSHLGVAPGLWLPEGLWLAFMRNSTGHCEEALRLTDDGLAEAVGAKNVIAEAYWMMVRSRVLYSLGRLEDARAQAETVLELGEQLGLGDFMNATAGVVLHRVSLRTGDLSLRDRARPLVQSLADGVGLTRTGRWSLAMEAQERMRPAEAYEYSRLAVETLRDATPSMTTPADFADDFVLAYICQVAGDFEAVELVARVAQERADRNPENALVAAVARAARGIRDRSADDLLAAAEQLRPGCRPLVTATLFEAVGIYATDTTQATSAMTEAVALYSRCGATRDVTRVLQQLRSNGVRQRPAAQPAERDYGGLSLRERQVASFISSGLTTQQIADELLVSPHTVVTYIRHIYAKWGLNSRREVAARYAEFASGR
ncbi:ATP-binding protein [Microbacterium neimengense]